MDDGTVKGGTGRDALRDLEGRQRGRGTGRDDETRWEEAGATSGLPALNGRRQPEAEDVGFRPDCLGLRKVAVGERDGRRGRLSLARG